MGVDETPIFEQRPPDAKCQGCGRTPMTGFHRGAEFWCAWCTFGREPYGGALPLASYMTPPGAIIPEVTGRRRPPSGGVQPDRFVFRGPRQTR